MKADSQKVLRSLKTARGQLESVLNMVEEDRYCLDIYNQILAVQALLKKANREIMSAHINSCIRESFESGSEEEKINELLNLLDKVTKC